jgi:hypothetical protein
MIARSASASGTAADAELAAPAAVSSTVDAAHTAARRWYDFRVRFAGSFAVMGPSRS